MKNKLPAPRPEPDPGASNTSAAPPLQHDNPTSGAPACASGMLAGDDTATLKAQLQEARMALQEVEARHRALIELSSDWYWEHDEHGRFTSISEQMLEKTGITVAEMIGRTRWETDIRYDPDDRARLEQDMAAHRPFYDFRFDRLRADGSARHVSITGAPKFDAAGRHVGYRGIGKDVTERRREQASVMESQQFARAALDALTDQVCVLDATGKIISVNSAWRRCATMDAAASGAFVGYSYLLACEKATAAGRLDGAAIAAGLREVLARRVDRFQHEYWSRSGDVVRWFALKATGFECHGSVRAVVVHEDITERKHAAARLLELNSLYQALSAVNETVARIPDRDALFFEVAGIAVRAGLFKFAKVWIREEDSPLVHAVVSVGREGEFLDSGMRAIDLSGPEARGPTGIALLEGRPDVCNDLDEERSLPWRERNAQAGFRSGAAFPIHENSKVVGTLSVYATTAGYFDGKFVELLSRIAACLSLGLDNLQREARRVAAETALRDSEARFRGLTELSADWYWELDDHYRFTEFSGGFATTMGLRPEHDLGKTPWELPLLGVTDEAWRAQKAIMAARLPFRDFQFSRLRKNGEVSHLSVSGAPIYDAAGRFTGYRGVGTELTERKSAERILALEHQVARCLATGSETYACITDVIRAICESQGWSCGFFSRADGATGLLHVSASWGVATPGVESFREASRGLVFSRDRSLSGHVWRTGNPFWTEDMAPFVPVPDKDLYAGSGMCCGFAFPVKDDSGTLGALSFFSSEVRAPDARMNAAASIIGGQISLFLKRRNAEEALRDSEARFRSLSDLSADWYWQQDADLRFTSLCNGTELAAGLAPEADCGKTRWELSGIGEAQWDLHKQMLADRLPFVDFEMKRAFPDGSVRDVCLSGTPIFDAAGNFTGYRGIGRDITHRKHEERILALEHRVAQCLATSAEASPVLKEVMRAVCETQRWSWGAYLRVDEAANVLRVDTLWVQPHEPSVALVDAVRHLAIGPGVGITGRVWQADEPLWVADAAADPRLLIPDAVLAAGYHGGFAFPSVADGRTVGVLLFFSRQVREPDQRLLSAAKMIGHQVGQFLQRRHAEEALRESERRYRALTELSSDWYWEQDEQQRFTRVSEGVQRRSGLHRDLVLGRTRWETGMGYNAAEQMALDACIAARQPFHDFAYRRVDANGVTRDLSISGEPMYDAGGRFLGYRGIGRDVTERKHAETQARFQAMLLNTVGDAIVATDLAGMISYWGAAAEQLFGWPVADAIGGNMLDVIQPVTTEADGSAALQEATEGRVWRGEKTGRRRDGHVFPVHLTLAPVHGANGTVTGVVGVIRDISDLKRAEEALQASAHQQHLIATFGQRALASTRLDTLLEQAGVAVVQGLDTSFCKILQLGPDGESLVPRTGLGWKEGWMDRHGTDSGPGTADHLVIDAREAVVVADYAKDTRFTPPALLVSHGIRSGANVFIGGTDGPFGVLGVYAQEPNRFGPESVNFLQSIANTLATAIDRVAAEEKVAYLAQFDALTGLPNRNLFHDRLALTLTQADRNGWNVGVMFVDLDRFKDVNDTYGHGAGDRLLNMMADRLQQCLRSGDTVGRLGGDEFAVVLSNLAKADDANVVAQQVVDALALPFDIDGRQIRVTASVGIAVYPADGEDPELLLNRSDAAMYLAKQQGRNSFHFYTEELNARVTRRIELETELRHAIDHNEFVLHYQPQISLDTGRIIGVEALIRWNHPQRGLLAPAEFISIAEETGLIVPIGRWVVDTACAQVAQWHRRGHRALFVAINVSPLEIRRGNVIDNIRHALTESALEPRHLEIELTETLIMDGADSFIRSLNALKEIGITIAIDDFGTGYSSLSYLKRFPVDKVKIDRIFIRDIVTETDDAAIVQAIIAMSHHLQLRVTAEGVETEEQAGFLRRCQCDIVQGFLFGAPVPAEQLGALLDSRGGVPLLQEPRGSARSLLLVDDEENNLRALQRVLRRDGYDIHTATSAQQALEVLAHTRISVIVSDQRMPGMSGTELLTRAKMLYPDTVRIILSGFTDLGTITAAINEGAIYKFLTKPWEDDVLRDDIRGAFRLHEHQRGTRSTPALEMGP